MVASRKVRIKTHIEWEEENDCRELGRTPIKYKGTIGTFSLMVNGKELTPF